MPIVTLKSLHTMFINEGSPLRELRYEPCCVFASGLLARGGMPWETAEAVLEEARQRGIANLPSATTLRPYVVSHSCQVATRCQFCRNYWALEYISTLDNQFIIGPGRPVIFREDGDGANDFFVCDEPRRKYDLETGEQHGLELCFVKHSNSLVKLSGTPCACHVYRKNELHRDGSLEQAGYSRGH